jgi:hypothetical protein
MKAPALKQYTPLLLITAFSFVLKALDPIRSPVIGALDPWAWTALTREFLVTRVVSTFFTQSGYPPTFMYLLATISNLGVDPYVVVRYIPIATALNTVPIYIFILEIFRSHKISALASVLTVTTRFYFMRTSIGVPEGLAHLFFVFMLLFILRAMTTRRPSFKIAASTFMAISILYYHFTLIILIPLIVVLPFVLSIPKRTTGSMLASIVLPAFLFSGIVWYFGVLPDMVHTYFGYKIYAYEIPIFQHSLSGLIHLFAYSVAKTGAVALGELGYVLTGLAVVGLGFVLFRRMKSEYSTGLRFILAYLAVLVFLAWALRIIYDLGLAGAGDSSVYLLSWLTVPSAAFASQGLSTAYSTVTQALKGKPRVLLYGNTLRIITVLLVVLLIVANLSAINYYKAPNVGGLGILSAHYYYKTMTDQEYYALEYLHSSTPKDSILLEIGVEPFMTTYQEIVAGRTIISVTNFTVTGDNLTLNGIIAQPDGNTTAVNGLRLTLNTRSQQPIYLLTGIRIVSLEIARTNGFPPAPVTALEESLLHTITSSTQYDLSFQNDQVTVIRISQARLTYELT